ncbi:uncharacterized protein [Rutidosis leptorrhynchoides]|uniref:uncharacterized protein n=1 Tax=Rutidosis leptorrhynchoides TaxID=125765 RepID=UPI003A9960E8
MSRHDMIPVNSPWSFNKWAIDIVGPFPAGPDNVKFLIVAIDYFTKWVRTKAVRTITGVQVRNIVWEYIVFQKFTSMAHPQANGLCEVTNHDIVSGIKKRLYEKRTVIPAEILVPTHRVANFDEEANDEALCENLNLIEERRLMAAIREANNKQQIANIAEKLGKLGPNWEGPYKVVAINAAGSYKHANIEGRNLPNVWHAALLKRYYA